MLVITTRKSPLALAQTEQVVALIKKTKPETRLSLKKMSSEGDSGDFSNIINPGTFVKKLELEVLEGKADLAVHSLKDVPTVLPQAMHLVSYLPRESYRDVMVFQQKKSKLFEAKKGVVGTSSIRRMFYLGNKFKSLKFSLLRGNINTRIKKLISGECDYLVLSEVGLKKLKLITPDLVVKKIPLEWMLPAPGQGVVVIETRKDNANNGWLAGLNHQATQECVDFERKIMQTLESGCNSPVGCLVRKQGSLYHLRLNWVKNFPSNFNSLSNGLVNIERTNEKANQAGSDSMGEATNEIIKVNKKFTYKEMSNFILELKATITKITKGGAQLPQ